MKLTAVVRAMRLQARGVVSLELVPAAGSVFAPFEAGAHIDLHLSAGLVRPYSLLNVFDAQDPCYEVAVLKEPRSRGGSRHVHEALRVGQTLDISAPRNHFALDPHKPADAPTVLLAGGIGITPLLGMMRELSRSAQPQRVHLIYAARTRAHAAYQQEIAALCKASAHQLSFQTHFDDEQGAPPDLHALLSAWPVQTRLYACGPAPMLDAFVNTCAQLGLTHARLERFAASAPPPSSTDRTETSESEGASSYKVVLQRSGAQLEVAAGQSILQALLDAGHPIAYSCGEGLCGSCETRVISGDVEHLDSILSASEQAANKSMMICVSRCRSGDLVLDL